LPAFSGVQINLRTAHIIFGHFAILRSSILGSTELKKEKSRLTRGASAPKVILTNKDSAAKEKEKQKMSRGV